MPSDQRRPDPDPPTPTSIARDGGSIDGNIAAAVVVRVDPAPVYGNDPGKPGFGTIVGVIDDGAKVFPAAARPTIVAEVGSGSFFRHIGAPRRTPVTRLVSLVTPDLEALTAETLFASIGHAAVSSVLHPAPLTVASGSKRYSFYSPELNLIAETALTTTGTPAIAYEYVWFNGHPVAQLDAGGAAHWTFTDHLGTPIVLTNADGSTYWRAEYEPYGAVYALRSPTSTNPSASPARKPSRSTSGPTE